MWKRWMRAALMNAAEGGSAAGGGGEGGAPAGAAATGQGGAAAGSALAGGAPAAPNYDYIPEKLRAMKEDGTLDVDASSRKLAEAYSTLETRLGTGDVRPTAVSDYTVTVPDTLKEAFDPATDQGMQDFLKGAHEAGLTQKQLDYVMGKYFDIAPGLVQGAQQLDAAGTTEALGKVWTDPKAYKENMGHAYAAASALAEKAGIPVASIMEGPLGNSPEFIRLMASIGPEMAEDRGQRGETVVSPTDRESLMKSEAYRNPKHADYTKVQEQVRRSYEKEYGTQAVA